MLHGQVDLAVVDLAENVSPFDKVRYFNLFLPFQNGKIRQDKANFTVKLQMRRTIFSNFPLLVLSIKIIQTLSWRVPKVQIIVS